MRAVYINSNLSDSEIVIDGDSFHHLVHVVRVRQGDEILLLNGKGKKSRAMVKIISKKNLSVQLIDGLFVERKFDLDLALGMPKKESLELCLRQATEIGFRNIHLIEADFSNIKDVELSRLEKILISSLEQSNSAYLPKISKLNWDEILYSNYDLVLRLESQPMTNIPSFNTGPKKALLIVGPEGGFSKRETDYFQSHPSIQHLNLPTEILRTSTAVSVGAGWLLKGLMDCT
jgi:16S rRNA (uracil1498-N3)-methyltransferase